MLKLKWLAFVFLALTVLAAMPGAEAQTPNSSRVSVCKVPFPVVATASTGVGFVNFCVDYPESVQPGEVFGISATLTAPTTVLPVFTTAANAYVADAGCTEGTPSVIVPTSNGVFGTQWTSVTSMTLTAGSMRCAFSAFATLTVAAAPLQFYNTVLLLNVRTENASIELSGELDVHQDPLSGELDIHQDQACGAAEGTPCHLRHQNFTADVAIGNQTVAFPDTLNIEFAGDVDAPGIDFWLLFWFWVAAILFFLYQEWLVALAFTIPGVLDAMFPTQIPGDFATYFLFCLLGVVLEFFAGERMRQYVAKRKS